LVPVTGAVESIPFDKQLFPVELLFPLPLLQPLINDVDDNDKSLFVNEELFDSFPFKIGVR
jgi:hypothetical protein